MANLLRARHRQNLRSAWRSSIRRHGHESFTLIPCATLISTVTWLLNLSVIECMFEACSGRRTRSDGGAACRARRAGRLRHRDPDLSELLSAWTTSRFCRPSCPRSGIGCWRDCRPRPPLRRWAPNRGKTCWRSDGGSPTEAHQRLAEAAGLRPRRTLTGEPLAPVLAATAVAQAAGVINAEHVTRCATRWTACRGSSTHHPRADRVDLVRQAVGAGPKELKKAADQMLFLLDQDGPAPDDTERARKRGLHAGPQGRDGTVPVKGQHDPGSLGDLGSHLRQIGGTGHVQSRRPRTLHQRHAHPGTDRQRPPQPGQRRHDALVAVGRMALESGELGQLNGLPTSIIIRTTLQDLESRAGIGTTGGGTMMPINDVDPAGRPREPLSGGVRQSHRIGAGPLPHQTHGVAGAADHAHRPRRRLHQTLLHRRRLRQPGPSRRARLARRRQHQCQRNGPGLRSGQPSRRQRRRLDHHHQRPKGSRMDTPTETRHRPGPRQLLPPPRTTIAPTRRADRQ